MSNFVNLHVHSDFSILDGGGTIERYVERVAEMGQPALGITDHGTLAGAYTLVREAKKYGIKPIIGIEAYVAPRSRRHKAPVFFGDPDQRQDDVSGAGRYLHLTLGALNTVGAQNLYRMQHEAYRTGFYGKPRIDLELLSRFSKGVFCLTGCLGGHAQTFLRLGKWRAAADWVYKLRSIFGERLFIEVMEHGLDMERRLYPDLDKLSRELKIPLIATADSHYCRQGDADAHDTLLCVQTKALKASTNRFMFTGAGYHLASYEEMLHGTSLPPTAIHNTMEAADMVEEYTGLFEPKLRLPSVDGDPIEILRRLVKDGVTEQGFSPAHFEASQYELGVIESAGFASYFVALKSAMDKGREAGIRFGPGRGSAAGSVVARALRITGVDPLEHGLLFERFLNPDRISVPDIDVDIDDTRRDDFLALVREEFGESHVAQVNAFGTIGAKSALKDSARALGYPYAVGNELASQLPPARFGRAPSLADFPQSYKSYPEIVNTARSIEGLKRSVSIHPSAVIVSPEPIPDQIPCRISESGKGALVVEFDGSQVDNLGFVKWDFLGLAALGVIEKCLNLIDEPVDLNEGLKDPNVFKLLSRGDTTGIFQLDSTGMRGLLNRVRPRSLGDVSAVLALYRPGPMGANAHTEFARRKNGQSRIEYPHREYEADLSDILSETFGVIVFQEQVLKILAKVGGYTYATAENIFNAMRKKDTEKMLAAKPEFDSRLRGNGYSEEAREALWNVLVPFSDYSFNKSHATSYAITALWQAYLKVHWPWQYWAALLTQEKDPKKSVEYVETALKEGVPILPPDINESREWWTPTPQGVRYGLVAIKGISSSTYNRIKGAGPYQSMRQFWEKAPAVVLKKNTLEALIKAGCFDSLEPSRETLYREVDSLAARAIESRNRKDNLYGDLVLETFDQAPFALRLRQKWEAEVLGVPITQEVLKLQLTRRLSPEEWLFVWRTLVLYPGLTPVDITVGPLTKLRRYAKVRKEKKLMEALATVGISDVDD